MNSLDLIGEIFGKLTVVSRKGSKHGRSQWLCKCDCGKEVMVTTNNLKNGGTKSCGCSRIGICGKSNTTHGASGKPLYAVWQAMRRRCSNRNARRFKDYGGRGISICQEWLESPNEFIAWALTNGYGKGKQLDRIDNNGNYEPNNCRFVTAKDNSNNRRDTVFYDGIPLTTICATRNLNYGTIKSRINRGRWPIEKAINTPIIRKDKNG